VMQTVPQPRLEPGHQFESQALPYLRQVRFQAGLRQRELARRVGVDPSIVSGWELGTRPVSGERIQDVADALGTSPRALGAVAMDEEPTPILSFHRPTGTPAAPAPEPLSLEHDARRVRVPIGVPPLGGDLHGPNIGPYHRVTYCSCGERMG